MIQVFDNIYIGGLRDEAEADVEVILNVAKDLSPTRTWSDVEYIHVGLVDGPGNSLAAYCAAVLALVSVGDRSVLVCCHEGGRSVVVVLMYLATVTWHSWDSCLAMMIERIDFDLPEPHEAHKIAFEKMNWRSLGRLLGVK